MRTALRGLGLGLGFGLAAAIVDASLAGIGTLDRRMGPGPVYVLQTAALLVGLGGLLGLVFAPLLRLRGGRLLAVAALAAAWLGLGWLVAFEAPMGRLFLLAPAVGGTLLLAAGLGVARRTPAAAWGLGIALLLAAAIGPNLYLDAVTPPATAPAALPPAPQDAPDVVVVVLDTVRARSSSAYGYGRATMPTLEALAREGTLFLDATSPSTWSLPSHASLFTGRYPTGHGAHGEHLF
ncbi:MAG: sulfatase-like hydrolase/transferase, partial [Myxococcota bacterium]|nr:sulfatase-like hydrolase/transferase [Myxococcota bacterium]